MHMPLCHCKDKFKKQKNIRKRKGNRRETENKKEDEIKTELKIELPKEINLVCHKNPQLGYASQSKIWSTRIRHSMQCINTGASRISY